MDTKTNSEQNEASSYRTKMPVDVRIVAYLLYAIGFFQLTVGCFLITGMGRLGTNYTRRVLFGTVLLYTELSHSIYTICLGFVHLLCAWGLIRGRKFSWWLLLIYYIYYIIDDVFLFQQHRPIALIGFGISIAIITWLCFRRQLYKVGLKQGPT